MKLEKITKGSLACLKENLALLDPEGFSKVIPANRTSWFVGNKEDGWKLHGDSLLINTPGILLDMQPPTPTFQFRFYRLIRTFPNALELETNMLFYQTWKSKRRGTITTKVWDGRRWLDFSLPNRQRLDEWGDYFEFIPQLYINED